MTVKGLIDALEKLDQDLPVCIISDTDTLVEIKWIDILEAQGYELKHIESRDKKKKKIKYCMLW